MADKKMVKLTYKPPKGEPWVEEFEEVQAAKMVKMGRWKKVGPAPTSDKGK